MDQLVTHQLPEGTHHDHRATQQIWNRGGAYVNDLIILSSAVFQGVPTTDFLLFFKTIMTHPAGQGVLPVGKICVNMLTVKYTTTIKIKTIMAVLWVYA